MNESVMNKTNTSDSQCTGGEITFKWTAANATIKVCMYVCMCTFIHSVGTKTNPENVYTVFPYVCRFVYVYVCAQ